MSENTLTDINPLEMTEELAKEGFEKAREYFRAPKEPGETHATLVLKALGTYSRIRATRANEAAITVAVAKMMGLQGEALAPLWHTLTGTDAQPFLPSSGEQSSDGATET